MARWLVIVAAAALPLVISPATADPFFLPKLVTAWLVVGALVVVLGLDALRGRVRLRRTALDVPLAIFVVSALMSTLLATNRNLAIFGAYGRYEGFLTIALYALLFWLSVQSLDGPTDATLVVRALLVVAFIASVLAIAQVAIGVLSGVGAAARDFSSGGFLRGYATFGNPNALAAFLAMLLPLAMWQLLTARSPSGRWLAVNLIVVMGLGLLVTFSRTSWAAAAIGVWLLIVVSAPRRVRLAVVALPVVLLVGLAVSSYLGARPVPSNVIGAAGARLETLHAPLSPGSSGQFRISVWVDTLRLVASRPLVGYGPDNFALVYPRFQTGNWAPGTIIDRPHNELLGIAASQGLLGLAAYVFIAFAIARAFWRRRRDLQSVALFGGVLAYAIYLLFNFSYLPVTLPFWIFAAAAFAVWRPAERVEVSWGTGPPARLMGVTAIAAIAIAAILLVATTYAADATYRRGLADAALGHRVEARRLINFARELAPWQSTYAVAAGSLALDLDGRGQPGADADWSSAASAYRSALQLGTANAAAYRYLAMSDAAVGLQDEAIQAARAAVRLDRFDPANQAELARLTAP